MCLASTPARAPAGWKHRCAGRHQVAWDTPLSTGIGADWRTHRGSDARQWRALAPALVDKLAIAWGLPQRPPRDPQRPAAPPSPRHQGRDEEEVELHPEDWNWSQPHGQLQFVVDNQTVAAILNGESVNTAPYYTPLCRRVANKLFTLFSRGWAPKGRTWIQWRPRKWNQEADAAANAIIDDTHTPILWDPGTQPSYSDSNIISYSDGAVRETGGGVCCLGRQNIPQTGSSLRVFRGVFQWYKAG